MSKSILNATKIEEVKSYLVHMVKFCFQPSAIELLNELESKFGWQIRWSILEIISELIQADVLTRSEREYFSTLIDNNSEDNMLKAIEGGEDTKVFNPTLDILLEEGQKYRNSTEFLEMIEFMAKFRRYSPYNNMLVKIQNPHCSMYATKADWYNRFERTLKEDAKPMLILAPKHPVMLVYDLDETEGKKLPQKLTGFAQYKGVWQSRWLANLLSNSKKYMIRVEFKKHSTTSAGFATLVSNLVICQDKIFKVY